MKTKFRTALLAAIPLALALAAPAAYAAPNAPAAVADGGGIGRIGMIPRIAMSQGDGTSQGSGIAQSSTIHVGLNGWLDAVDVGSSDTAYGWVCMNPDSVNTANYGSLDVYLNGPAGFGYYYGNFPLTAGTYGVLEEGVNEAGFCSVNPYVGFELSGWFSQSEDGSANSIYVYWRDNAGHLTQLGGSGLQMTNTGMNPPQAGQ